MTNFIELCNVSVARDLLQASIDYSQVNSQLLTHGRYWICVASFPGPAQLFVAESDGKRRKAEQGLGTRLAGRGLGTRLGYVKVKTSIIVAVLD